MPIGLSPKRAVTVWLDGDKADEPDENKRQGFKCKHLTCDEVVTIAELTEKITAGEEAKDERAVNGLLDQVLTIGVTDVVNISEGRDAAIAALTPLEKYELFHKMQTETRLAERDRKNSGSSQPSDTAASAGNVEAPAAA